jgi:hypothetical protein
MMERPSGVVVRRAFDRSSRVRRPLRLGIRRGLARQLGGERARFVTQVLFGESGAVLVPRGAEPVVADGLSVVELPA